MVAESNRPTLPIVAPDYVSDLCLPYASDVFYHQRVIYSLPVGFTPLEFWAVAGFPSYCRGESVELPELIWDMCNSYFEAGEEAVRASAKIEPLRKTYALIVQLVYARDRDRIAAAKELLVAHPALMDAFEQVNIDRRLVGRELLSHVLYEVFIQDGYDGAIRYLKEVAGTPSDALLLIAAVVTNRLEGFVKQSAPMLIYESTWYPFLVELSKITNGGTPNEEATDESIIEHFRFKLFEAILLPVFGRCDSAEKSQWVADLAQRKKAEIEALKQACGAIAVDVALMPTDNRNLRQERLATQISERVIEPLTAILDRPRQESVALIRDALIDSGLISAVLSAPLGASINTIGMAALAGTMSAIARQMLRSADRNVEPSALLAQGMIDRGIKYQPIFERLRSISLESVDIVGRGSVV
jgi:hypothetical protein